MTQAQEARLIELLEQWYAAIEDGEPLTLDDLCVDDPEFLEPLRSMIDETESAANALGVIEVDRTFGGYRILESLGGGGNGEVHSVVQLATGDIQALKRLHPNADETWRARFDREIAVVTSLTHPSVIPIFDSGKVAGQPFYTMPYCPLGSLDDAKGHRDQKRIAAIGIAAADALHTAHLSGILHRDVKPSNILLAEDGGIYVADFGLAWTFESEDLTASHVHPGTFPYMAPEQLQQKSILDPRCDVYSLGLTLYEAFTGTHPFGGASGPQLLRDIVEKEIPRISGLSHEGRKLERILRKAMEKDPRDRFHSCAELAEELQRFLDGRPIQTRSPSLVTRARKLVRRHRRLATILSAALLIAMAGIIWGTNERRKKNEARGRVIRHAEVLLDADRPRDALNVLAAFDEDGRSHDDVKRIQGRLRGEIALQEFVDLLVFGENLRRSRRLPERFDALETSGAFGLRPALGLAARSIALLAMGRAEEVARVTPPAGAGRRYPRTWRVLSGGQELASRTTELGAEAPDDAATDLALAHVVMRLRAAPREDIVAAIEKGLLLSSSNRRCLQAHARLRLEGGEPEVALGILQGLSGRFESSVPMLLEIAFCKLALDRVEEAREIVARLDLPETNLERLKFETSARIRELDFKGARETIQQALAIDPGNAFFNLRRGELLVPIDLAAARQHFEAASGVDPDSQMSLRATFKCAELEGRAMAGPRFSDGEIERLQTLAASCENVANRLLEVQVQADALKAAFDLRWKIALARGLRDVDDLPSIIEDLLDRDPGHAFARSAWLSALADIHLFGLQVPKLTRRTRPFLERHLPETENHLRLLRRRPFPEGRPRTPALEQRIDETEVVLMHALGRAERFKKLVEAFEAKYPEATRAHAKLSGLRKIVPGVAE